MAFESVNPYSLLPNDTWDHVFKFLDAKTLAKVEQVCKDWRDLLNRDRSWYDAVNPLYTTEIEGFKKKFGDRQRFLSRFDASNMSSKKVSETLTAMKYINGCLISGDSKGVVAKWDSNQLTSTVSNGQQKSGISSIDNEGDKIFYGAKDGGFGVLNLDSLESIYYGFIGTEPLKLQIIDGKLTFIKYDFLISFDIRTLDFIGESRAYSSITDIAVAKESSTIFVSHQSGIDELDFRLNPTRQVVNTHQNSMWVNTMTVFDQMLLAGGDELKVYDFRMNNRFISRETYTITKGHEIECMDIWNGIAFAGASNGKMWLLDLMTLSLKKEIDLGGGFTSLCFGDDKAFFSQNALDSVPNTFNTLNLQHHL